MDLKAELAPKSPGNDLGKGWTLVDARLRKLRRERRLVERAIVALTEMSRTRQSRARRAHRV
jgi:hypothetical protein